MSSLRVRGLKWRPRKNGEAAAYWVASAEAVSKGFRPTVVRISYDLSDPFYMEHIAFCCAQLNAEVQDFRSASGNRRDRAAEGTIRALIEHYIYDIESPFHRLKHTTQAPYLKYAQFLIKTIGLRAVHACDGRDVQRWFKMWSTANEGTQRLAKAQMCLTVLKSALAFGIMCKREHCADLREIIRVMRFSSPRSRNIAPTREQIVAIRKAAHEIGHPAVALATALQFETMQRMWDVVGQWLPLHAPEVSAITHRGRKWIGPQWSDVSNGILRWQPTKTNRTSGKVVEIDLSVCPMVVEELLHVPAEARTGPLILAANGLPYPEIPYRYAFRQAARKAGVPDSVWCRDIRAGGITEARKSGASLADASKTAGHSSVQTTARVYDRDTLEAHRRVAAARPKSITAVESSTSEVVFEDTATSV